MKISHLADLHLGFRQYHRQTSAGVNQREADVANAFRAAVDGVISARPDAVIIAGDLFQAVRGRNGDAPLVVLAAATPGDCFYMGIEAVRLATKYMTPVMVLTDGYLANGAEPWKIPSMKDFAPFPANDRDGLMARALPAAQRIQPRWPSLPLRLRDEGELR